MRTQYVSVEQVHLWWWNLDDAAAVDPSTMSSDEHDRAQRFRFERDRLRYVCGRTTLRMIVGAYISIAPQDLRFDYGPQEKPVVRGADVHFNLAHSGSVAVLAVARKELGVDVEVVRRGFADDEIAERFFAPTEIVQLRRLPQAAQEAAFFRCWTRKEAYLKALGGGLSLPLDAFTVEFANEGLTPRITSDNLHPDATTRWNIFDVSQTARQFMNESIVAAVVADSAVTEIVVSQR